MTQGYKQNLHTQICHWIIATHQPSTAHKLPTNTYIIHPTIPLTIQKILTSTYSLNTHYKKKLYYCDGPKQQQKPKKLSLKVKWTFSDGGYCGSSTPPLLWCHYRSIAMVTKSATIDRPFSSAFGLLRQAENRHHMRLPLELSDLLVAGIKRCYKVY